MIFSGISIRRSTPSPSNERNFLALRLDRLAMGGAGALCRAARTGISAAGDWPQRAAFGLPRYGDGGRRHIARSGSTAAATHRLRTRVSGLPGIAGFRLLPPVRRATRALPAVHLSTRLLHGDGSGVP